MLYKEKRGKNTLVPGLSNNAKTRPLMIDALYSYLTQFPESIRSMRLALELTGLVSKTSGKVEADSGCTDDIALATACCMYVRKYDPPVMLSSTQHTELSNEMMSIINMNSDVYSSIEFNNASIIKNIKQNYKEHSGGFIDILKYFKE